MMDDRELRLECIRASADEDSAKRMYAWITGEPQAPYQPSRPADAVSYSVEEGGEWWPVALLKEGAAKPELFALKLSDGWIWDRIVGWRRHG